ncbi:MAG: hypothetical protein ACLPKT_03400 [Methylocella sp.]
MTTRPAAVAGQFYAGDPDQLRTQILQEFGDRNGVIGFCVTSRPFEFGNQRMTTVSTGHSPSLGFSRDGNAAAGQFETADLSMPRVGDDRSPRPRSAKDAANTA